MINKRSLPLCALASAVLSCVALAQTAAPAVRITSAIDENQLVTLKGNVNPHANPQNDRGPVSASFQMPDLTLVLSRSAEQQAAFDAYVESEYDSSSPNFHQWLTPAEIGERFGPAQADIATVTGWLSSHGFTVNRVSPDGMTIHFAGTAGQIKSTFHTEIHSLSVNGVSHYANMSNPQIPAALAPVVLGVKALHNFLPHPLHHLGSMVQFNQQAGGWQRMANSAPSRLTSSLALSTTPSATPQLASTPHPLYGISGTSNGSAFLEEDVAPYDFATIYNVLPLWNASTPINGSGQTIAIAGTSEICLGQSVSPCNGRNDVATFRSAFGLPAGLTPNEIDAGPYFNTGSTASICTSTSANASCGPGDLTENSLDVEWSGAVAPGAQVDLVVTGQTAACNTSTGAGCVDTLYDSAAYVVENVTAKILSLSYGACELGMGTTANVAYYNLWQSAKAEGISVFVSTGDSGSPSCDDGQDQNYGNPYTAQYGLSVNGIASTPFNTAVGGTDFSWCQPYVVASGSNLSLAGCPTSTGSGSGETPYWNSSNNTTTGASAAGYVPEIPWNDTCESPIWGRYLATLLSADGFDAAFSVNPTTPEETCSVINENIGGYPGWFQYYDGTSGGMIAEFVDTVGGSGGASNCVSNDADTNSTSPTCNSSATTVANGSGSIALSNDGWQKPSWQANIAGIPNDGVRDIPDVSFFAGDGSLNSATLICVTNDGAECTSLSATGTGSGGAEEVGGTSVATPEMAGVMALINQKSGGAQGLANPELYQLAGKQTYSGCSAETVKSNSSCYFQDIDNGLTASSGPAYTTAQTISMPCNLNNEGEGGAYYQNGQWLIMNGGLPAYAGTTSPNCTAINSGDVVGTLVSSGTTAAYNSGTGFDLATGLGSLNVANVVNAWVSSAGTGSSIMTVTPTPAAITINQSVSVVVSVTGSAGTPTGTITLSGNNGYTSTATIGTSPCTSNTACAFTIPANSLAAGGSVTLTATYSGDANYASNTQTATIAVNVMTPAVTVNAPATNNVANTTTVTVTLAGPTGSIATPSGSVYLTSGSYTSSTATLTNGSATIVIPANSLAVGTDTITADYSGDANYAGSHAGTATIVITQTTTLTPVVVVTPSLTSLDSGQSLGVTVSVTGTGATPTGTISLTSGSYTSSTATIGTSSGCTSNTSCSFAIPANTLAAGSDTITANYNGDSNYVSGKGTASVTVTLSTYALSATTPATVSPGTSASSTVTGTSSSTDYSGTVTLNSCSLTSSSVTNPTAPPTCSITGTITYSSGTASGSGTASVTTTAPTTAALVRPAIGNPKGWLGAGGGAVLAFLVFLGVPAWRKSWRAMLGMVVLLAVLGSMAACGGGSTPVTSSIPGTSAGTYTFTVSGSSSPSVSPAPTTTFTVTVN